METKINVTKEDIENQGDSRNLLALESAISRNIKTDIIINTLMGGVLAIWRKDNNKHGYCLGFLPEECYEKHLNPFSFLLKYTNPELARPKKD